MCLIAVAVGASPHYPLLVAANRDEQHARPASSAAGWHDQPGIFGGRDLRAGGTWLAVDRRGRFAAVTNVRDPERPQGRRSRGSLVADFLTGGDSAARYAARAARDGEAFGPFNLLVYDGREVHFASNRAAAMPLGTGLHAFSNAPAGVEWPKTSSVREGVQRWLEHPAPLEPLFALLAERGESAALEQRYYRAHFVVGPTYGTRCSTVVLVDGANRLTFVERSFDEAGRLSSEARETFELER